LKPLVGITSLAQVEPTLSAELITHRRVSGVAVRGVRPPALPAHWSSRAGTVAKPLEFFIFIGSLGPPHPRGALVLYCTNWEGTVHGPGDIVVLSGSKFKESHHIIIFIQA
jgi:hypothetical protein